MSDYKDKVTKGFVQVCDSFAYPVIRVIGTDNQGRKLTSFVAMLNCGGVDNDANAKLIAEAFNVLHETGLTPRELVAQRDRLLAALKCAPLRELFGMVEDSGDAQMWSAAVVAMEIRDAAIAACETKDH